MDKGRNRRKFDLFRRIGMFDKCDGLIITKANTKKELHTAYSLVHSIFVQKGYILPQPDGVRIRPYEYLPNTITFIAKIEDSIVGVISIVPDTTEHKLPSDKAFSVELDLLRNEGRYVCEITNLAIDSDYRNSGIFMELIRCCIAQYQYHKYTDTFISVSKTHGSILESFIGFEPWGHCRNYNGVDTTIIDPVEGKRLDLPKFKEKILAIDIELENKGFLYDWFFASNPY